MAIRVTKGQSAKRRPGRRTRGASHNPRRSPAVTGSSRGNGQQGRSSDRESGRGAQAGRPRDTGKWKILLGVAIFMVVVIIILAASGGGSRAQASRGRTRRTTRGQSSRSRKLPRDRSFRDYMQKHGTTDELKKRKARIEAHERGKRR